MIEVHGTYLRDVQSSHTITEVTIGQAIELLKEHVDPAMLEQHGEMDPTDPNILLNKGWVALKVEGDEVVCLYNHDGTYSLRNVEKSNMVAYAVRGERPGYVPRITTWCREQNLAA